MSARGKLTVNGCKCINRGQRVNTPLHAHRTLTVITSSMPYSNHSVLGSRRPRTVSVCSCVRRTAYASKVLLCAVHLRCECKCCHHYMSMHLLRTPTLDGTCEQYLLGVISDEGNEVVDNTSEMSVRTSTDDGCGHPWAKRGENGFERRVKQLAFEVSKMRAVIVFAVT